MKMAGQHVVSQDLVRRAESFKLSVIWTSNFLLLRKQRQMGTGDVTVRCTKADDF